MRCPWVLVYPLGVPEEWFLWWACKPEIHLALIFFTDPLQKLNQNWAHVWHQTRAKVESKVGPRLAPKAGTPRFGQATEKNSGSPKCSQKCTPFSHEKIRTPKPGFRYPCVKNVCPVQDRHLCGILNKIRNSCKKTQTSFGHNLARKYRPARKLQQQIGQSQPRRFPTIRRLFSRVVCPPASSRAPFFH